jgi:hypothetical protein
MVELIAGMFEGQDELGRANITSYPNHRAIDTSLALPPRAVGSIYLPVRQRSQ